MKRLIVWLRRSKLLSMRIISYNVRGLGGRRKKWAVKEMVAKEKAEFVCLQETKLESVDMRIASILWGDKSCGWVYSGSTGASGGLICLWDSEVFVRSELWGEKGLLGVAGLWKGEFVNIVNVYSSSDPAEKNELWAALESKMRGKENEKWCIVGDFNSIRCEEERRGSGSFSRMNEMRMFNTRINQLNLIDIPLERRKYTWYKDNGKSSSRLDRFLLSAQWVAKWPNLSQIGIKRRVSDHVAILLRDETVDWGPKPFKFVNGWMKEEGFKKVVTEAWANGEQVGWKGYIIKEKFKSVKEKIKEWQKENVESLVWRIERKEDELNAFDVKMEKSELDESDLLDRKKTWDELNRLRELQDNLRVQQAKSRWVKEGDTNSKYFHKIVECKGRMRQWKGVRIKGKWLEDVGEVKEGVRLHFENLFADKNASDCVLPPCMEGHKLSADSRLVLEARFTEEEIRSAVWGSGLDKSPGPDGFAASFFREFWETIKEDVVGFFNEFYVNGKLAKGLNYSFITLIPKCANPTAIEEFRPISLIGSLYKILAKVLANRLAKVVGEVIDRNQSAFLSSRNIMDGIVVANEVVDEAKKEKKHIFMFKVDFEKAYDSVCWSYLFEMLKLLNFGDKWCGWMKECISSAEASVLVNGSPTRPFKMRRGLRQGDPLSPFLYLIVAEGLSRMMVRACDCGEFKPLKVGKKGVVISHLQYADDSIFFGEAKKENIGVLKCVLRSFELVSGLKVNFHKSCLFGLGVESEICDNWANVLNCGVGKIPFVYLGLPIGARSSDKVVWSKVIDRLELRLAKWENNFLSFGGRLVLLKSVLTSLPLYYFSFFKVPPFVLNQIKKLQCHLKVVVDLELKILLGST